MRPRHRRGRRLAALTLLASFSALGCAGTPFHETARDQSGSAELALQGVFAGMLREVQRTEQAVTTSERLIGPREFERIGDIGHRGQGVHSEWARLPAAAATVETLWQRELTRIAPTEPRRASPQESVRPPLLR